MTGTVESILGNHGARLDEHQRELGAISTRLDQLLFLMLGTLFASVGALAVIAFKH